MENKEYQNLIRELFNDIPIDLGIKAIVNAPNLAFNYSKTAFINGFSETWFTELETFLFRITPNVGLNLEITRNADDKRLGQYHVIMRLFYDKEEAIDFLREEFYQIKKEFEELGEKVIIEQIMNEDYDSISESVHIYFDKKILNPCLFLSFESKLMNNEYQIFIMYTNRLSTSSSYNFLKSK